MHLTFYDYSHCDIHEQDFSERNLAGANFSSVIAYGTLFNGADLHGADFTWADLRGAYFIGADLRDASFRGADLSKAVFAGCPWRGSELDEAHLNSDTALTDNRTITDEDEQHEVQQYLQAHRPELRIIQLKPVVAEPREIHTESRGLVQWVKEILRRVVP